MKHTEPTFHSATLRASAQTNRLVRSRPFSDQRSPGVRLYFQISYLSTNRCAGRIKQWRLQENTRQFGWLQVIRCSDANSKKWRRTRDLSDRGSLHPCRPTRPNPCRPTRPITESAYFRTRGQPAPTAESDQVEQLQLVVPARSSGLRPVRNCHLTIPVPPSALRVLLSLLADARSPAWGGCKCRQCHVHLSFPTDSDRVPSPRAPDAPRFVAFGPDAIGVECRVASDSIASRSQRAMSATKMPCTKNPPPRLQRSQPWLHRW
jgi:hypothetical protein